MLNPSPLLTAPSTSILKLVISLAPLRSYQGLILHGESIYSSMAITMIKSTELAVLFCKAWRSMVVDSQAMLQLFNS